MLDFRPLLQVTQGSYTLRETWDSCPWSRWEGQTSPGQQLLTHRHTPQQCRNPTPPAAQEGRHHLKHSHSFSWAVPAGLENLHKGKATHWALRFPATPAHQDPEHPCQACSTHFCHAKGRVTWCHHSLLIRCAAWLRITLSMGQVQQLQHWSCAPLPWPSSGPFTGPGTQGELGFHCPTGAGRC